MFGGNPSLVGGKVLGKCRDEKKLPLMTGAQSSRQSVRETSTWRKINKQTAEKTFKTLPEAQRTQGITSLT